MATAATTTTPTPKPVKGNIRIFLRGIYVIDRGAVTIPDRTVTAIGVVRPYVPGQWVLVRARVGYHLLGSALRRLIPSRNGRFGYFSVRVVSRWVGTVVIHVTHGGTNKLKGFVAHRDYSAVVENMGWGSTGRFVQLMQARLAALHFYILQTGVYDAGMGWAIDAYHRLLGWGTYQTLDQSTVNWLLNGWGTFQVRYPDHGKHAEGDLGHQLLALTYGSQVYQIYPISSGKPSTPTVLGNFSVYRKDPGYLPDGMYYSNFFYGGYAIHGYDPAPDYPASHGCMRVPIDDAIPIYNWLNFGDGVDTYY